LATLKFMRKPILNALLGFVALFFASCAQHRIPQTTQPDKSTLVQVAVITTEVGDWAGQILQRAGIRCIIEAGSVDAAAFSGVWVSRSVKPRAISALQADPRVQKSMPFAFP
jgi:hypothetical protein